MSGLIKAYVKSVWRESRMHAIYPPDDSVQVGDVFDFSGGQFSRLFNVSEKFGDVQEESSKVADWSSKASDGTSVEVAANGELPDGSVVSALANIDAGVAVKLQGESSYVAALSGIQKKAIGSLAQLKEHIRSEFFKNDWDSSWIVATEVFSAENATIIGGSSSATTVALEASGDVEVGGFSLIDLASNVNVVTTGSAAMVVTGKNLTPLFRGYKFRLRDLLGVDRIEPELEVTEWDPEAESEE